MFHSKEHIQNEVGIAQVSSSLYTVIELVQVVERARTLYFTKQSVEDE